MDDRVQKILDGLTGKPCWRKQVGSDRSLSLGFGEKVQHRTNLTQRVYGEWEIGTYRCAWRVVKRDKVLCGSQDTVDSVDEMNLALDRIDLGHFVALHQLTTLDVRVYFDSGYAVDFLATISDDDECLHIFCPGKLVIVFSVIDAWKLGPSNKPWN